MQKQLGLRRPIKKQKDIFDRYCLVTPPSALARVFLFILKFCTKMRRKKVVAVFCCVATCLFLIWYALSLQKDRSCMSSNNSTEKLKQQIEYLGGIPVYNRKKTSIGQIMLDNHYITDCDFLFLVQQFETEVKDVWHIRLNNAGISNDSVRVIAVSFPSLFNCELNWTAIGDEGLASLVHCKSLRVLTLKGTNISDDAIKYLGQLKQLTTLDISGTRVSEEGMKNLEKELCFPKTHIKYRKLKWNECPIVPRCPLSKEYVVESDY